MHLFFATGNIHKYEELRSILTPFSVVLHHHQPLISPNETGRSFRENAAIKALAARDQTGAHLPAAAEPGFLHQHRDQAGFLAEDSGLEIDALGGAPGIDSATYSGSRSDANNMAQVLAQLAGIPPWQRTARFRCVFCLSTENGLFFAEGICPGWIALHPTGQLGFGYDPIFIPTLQDPALPKGLISRYAGTTLGSMPQSVKNQFSHRNQALRQLLNLLAHNHLRQQSTE